MVKALDVLHVIIYNYITRKWRRPMGNKTSEQEDKKVGISIRLPSDMLQRIDALAEEELRTRTAQMEKLLKESLEAQQTTPSKKR